jgi:BASS family bile acid:Na+ symporter
MLKVLHWLAAHGTKIVAGSIFVGLVLPDLAALARPVFPVAVFCMLTIAMIRVDLAAAKAYAARPGLIITAMVWMTVATPLLIAGTFWAFDPSPAIALALIFWATAPATVSSPAFSALLGLNATLSLGLLLMAMLTAPFIVPELSVLLTDAEIVVTTGGLMLRLGLLIGGAAIAATMVRGFLGPQRRAEADPVFDALNVVFMTLFAIAAMDSVTDTMIARPWHVAGLIALTAALSVGCLSAATLLFWRSGPVAAATFGFSNGNRNMALVLGALAGNVPADTWLFFAVAQFPIYLLPLLLKPVYGRLLARSDA